jgi:hypothetical protein
LWCADDGWGCDWPGHANHSNKNSFSAGDKLYGCDTIHDCNWGICGLCWDSIKNGLDDAKIAPPPAPDVADDKIRVVQPFCTKSKINESNYCIVNEISREGESFYVEINCLCDNTWGAAADPTSEAKLTVVTNGTSKVINANKFERRSKDKFQVKGLFTFRIDAATLSAANAVYFRYGGKHGQQLVYLPGAEPYSSISVPVCSNGHLMAISDYAEGGYAYGFGCNVCRLNKTGERWFCQDCQDDYCFECEPSIICHPLCPNHHPMTRHNRSAADDYIDICCGRCNENLSDRIEHYYCGLDSIALCLTCAFAVDEREKIPKAKRADDHGVSMKEEYEAEAAEIRGEEGDWGEQEPGEEEY